LVYFYPSKNVYNNAAVVSLVSYPLRLISFFPYYNFLSIKASQFFLSDDQFIVYIKAKRIYIHVSLIYIYRLIAFIEKAKDTLALLIYKYVKNLSRLLMGLCVLPYMYIHTHEIDQQLAYFHF
jgi:hypothetical protein